MVWGGISRSVGSDLFFSSEQCSWSRSISQCIYTRGVFIASAGHADFNNCIICTLQFLCNDLDMPLITGVIFATFYNILHWCRSYCSVWNVRWLSSVTDFRNVGGYQWGWLLRPSCSCQEGLISGVAMPSEGGTSSGQWIPRKEECPRGRWFLERSDLENN